MPPERCDHCNQKWFVLGGGLCQTCRTVDRLASYIRGPSLPADCEQVILQRLRAWIAEVQDLSELSRGVVPTPTAVGVPKGGAPPPVAGPPPAAPPGEAGPSELPPATTPKVPPPAPPPPPPSLPAEPKAPPHAPPGEAVDPPRSSGSQPSVPKPEKKAKKRRESSSPRRSRKSKRRSRSGRTPRRSRSPLPRLASPVRPAGVKDEEEEGWSDDPGTRRERKARPRVPRSPSRSPPRRDHGRRPPPSQRPIGRRWVGPIPAKKRQPPPGFGVHFGKNKGQTKRDKRAEYNRRRGRRR